MYMKVLIRCTHAIELLYTYRNWSYIELKLYIHIGIGRGHRKVNGNRISWIAHIRYPYIHIHAGIDRGNSKVIGIRIGWNAHIRYSYIHIHAGIDRS